MLCNSVPSGLTNQCLVPSYAINSAGLSELLLIEFKTIISYELLYLPFGLVLNKSLELLEYEKRLIFLSQEVNPDLL